MKMINRCNMSRSERIPGPEPDETTVCTMNEPDGKRTYIKEDETAWVGADPDWVIELGAAQ